MRIGFMGPGVVKRPMAGHLIDAGRDPRLYRVKDVDRHLVGKGGKEAASARAAAVGRGDGDHDNSALIRTLSAMSGSG